MSASDSRQQSPAMKRSHQIGLCIALFMVAYVAQTVSPVMLLYTIDLHLDTTDLTLFFTVYAIGLMASFVAGGPLADRYGRKALVMPSTGLLLAAVAALLAAAVWGKPMILAARFIQGLTSGAVFTVGTVWLRELAGSKRAGAASMLATGVMAFGFAIGPFVSGILVQWGPWPKLLSFVVAFILVLLAIAIISKIPETLTTHRHRGIPIGLPAGTYHGFVTYLLPCGLLVYTFTMLSLIAFPMQLHNAGFTEVYFILGISALLVQGFAAAAAIGAMRLGPRHAGWLAGACGAIGCTLGYLAVLPGGWPWVIPASIAIGLANGLSMASGVAVADRLAPSDGRASLISMFYMVVYLGYSSPTLLSLIGGSHTMEHAGTILGLGVLSLIIMVILWRSGAHMTRTSEPVTTHP